MSNLELKNIMQSAGIIGAGGAGFPSYAKLAEGADLLVINCAECEPLIYTEYMLMREEMTKIAEGARLVMSHLGVTHTYISLKEYRGKILGYTDGQLLADGVSIKLMPNIYPIGDEINLIYQTTGRLIKPGNLPISAGVIVFNGETIYNIYNAVTNGAPVTEKWVTVAGNIPERRVVKVPVGMRVTELFRVLGIKMAQNEVLFDGGPSMGKIENPENSIITKTTNALLIIPDTAPAVTRKKVNLEDMLRRAASCCCACTRCTEMCPRHLLGYPLEPHKMIRAAMTNVAKDSPELVKTATLCCSCGICAEVCCQDISPKDVIAHLKGILAKEKIRYTAGNEEYKVSSDREYRMIPSHRWESLLGVKKYEVIPELVENRIPAKKVEIRMTGHIGAPSVPVVSVGDIVKVGQLIANAAEGLSIPQHASIDGKVTFVSNEKIIIEA